MNIDCLFTILLFSDLGNIVKLLLLSRHTKSLANDYLWKLLCDRDYAKLYIKIDKDSFMQKYIVCNDILKIKYKVTFMENYLPIQYEVDELYDSKQLCCRSAYQSLKTVPSELGQLQNLNKLNLNCNHLTYIPIELCQLSNLRQLYLCDNQLTHIPIEINQLYNLQSLELQYNKLTNIPVQLCKLTNLQRLTLNNNKLESIPNELCYLIKLDTLLLNDNQLTYFPVDLFHLTNLTHMNISNNKLTNDPAELCDHLSNLVLYH